MKHVPGYLIEISHALTKLRRKTQLPCYLLVLEVLPDVTRTNLGVAATPCSGGSKVGNDLVILTTSLHS